LAMSISDFVPVGYPFVIEGTGYTLSRPQTSIYLLQEYAIRSGLSISMGIASR
jgi:hypothetical protein